MVPLQLEETDKEKAAACAEQAHRLRLESSSLIAISYKWLGLGFLISNAFLLHEFFDCRYKSVFPALTWHSPLVTLDVICHLASDFTAQILRAVNNTANTRLFIMHVNGPAVFQPL